MRQLLYPVKLAGLLLVPVLSLPPAPPEDVQQPLTFDQIKERAKAVVKEPIIQLVLGPSGPNGARHVAFVAREQIVVSSTSSFPEDTLLLFDVTGERFTELWRRDETLRRYKFDFAVLPGDTAPSLRIDETPSCGSGGCSRTLVVYSVERRRAFSIAYTEDWSTTPRTVFKEDDSDAQDSHVRSWLQNWARELGIYKAQPAINLEDPENIEDAWVHDNGHKTTGIVKLRYYSGLPEDYQKQCAEKVIGARYTWSSCFKRGVIGFDNQTRRYFMVYLPENRYDWIKKLAFRGPWLYMSSDCFNPAQLSSMNYRYR